MWKEHLLFLFLCVYKYSVILMNLLLVRQLFTLIARRHSHSLLTRLDLGASIMCRTPS